MFLQKKAKGHEENTLNCLKSLDLCVFCENTGCIINEI